MKTFRTLSAILVVAGGLLFGEAAVRPAQVAEADNWEYYISNKEVYCEGCCSGGGTLCCPAANKCRIYPT